MLTPSAATRRRIGCAALALSALILPWMGAEPGLAPPGDGYTDKILHVTCFAGLAVVGFWSFRSRWGRTLMLLTLICIGVGIEGVQATVPGREASIEDIVADLGGLGLATILLLCWLPLRDMIWPVDAYKGGDRGGSAERPPR